MTGSGTSTSHEVTAALLGGDVEEEGEEVRRAGSMSSTSSAERGSMSRAIQGVLDQHRARSNASNPLLEPKGRKSTSSGTSSSSDWDQLRTPYGVTCTRWGIRAVPDAGPGSGTTPSEVEFEIEVTLRGAAAAAQADKAVRSVTWHTSSEVLRLHTALVSLQGDLAPRRPRLKSSTSSSQQQLSNAELSVDMRSIACKLSPYPTHAHAHASPVSPSPYDALPQPAHIPHHTPPYPSHTEICNTCTLYLYARPLC